MSTTGAQLKYVPSSTSRFQVDGAIYADGVTVDIRQSGWDEACENWFEPETCMFHYALAPEPTRNVIQIPGQRHFAPPGRIAYLPAGAKCLTRCFPGDTRSLCVIIDPRQVAHSLGIDALESDACLDIRSHAVEHGLSRLLKEVHEPGFASLAMVEMAALTLIIECCRHLMTRDCRSAEGSKLPAWRMKRLKERIDSDLAGTLSVRGLAEECSMSVRHLIRTFKNTEGMAISDYIARERIARAQERLRSGTALVKAIAGECGFRTPQSFSTAFRRAIGVTPTKYRDEHMSCR